MILTTQRLVLRPMVAADAPALFAILGDPTAMRFWDRPAIRRLAVVENMTEEQLAAMAAGRCLYWTAFHNDEAIGGLDLSFIQDGNAQCGFLFRRDQWGQGYATEALGALIVHAFDALELDTLHARIHAANRAAARTLEKSGFQLEEMRPGYRLESGALVACEFYVRLAPREIARNGT